MNRLFYLLLILLALSFALSGSGHAEANNDRSFTECTHCPVMVGIPAGRFVMGSPKSERGRFDAEGPQHIVSIGAFALGKFDVTSEQFQIFLQETGYQPEPCNKITNMKWHSPRKGFAYPPEDVEPPKWPAVCLDWKDAEAYIAWLNARVRKEHPSIAYKPGGPYRLPSEAEWEYAARGGTTTARWWGNEVGNGNANCNGCGSKYDFHILSDVDSFKPNPFGLYGMLGNAWQWTADCWHPSYVGAPKNGSAWTTGDCSKHVIRGGSWDNTPIFIRSATRSGSMPDGGEFDYSSLSGFRVARDLP
ncbi:MAG: formylglycine-generating enzyme family protein [Proteobacteria bacterium]|nr:formylglycine-generating enzyme family protein [Pseudomonadota bacterium]